MPGKKLIAGAPSNNVIPSGTFDGSRVTTICKPNATPYFHKTAGSKTNVSHVFDAADPIAQRPASTRGRHLHTDPFDEGRTHITRPPVRLIQHPTPVEHAQATRHVVPAAQVEKKSTFITGNCIVSRGGKQVSQQKFETTHANDQPTVNYASMARFRTAANVCKEDFASPVNNASDLGAVGDVSREIHHRPHKVIRGNGPTLVGVLAPVSQPQPASYSVRPPWGTGTPRRAAAPRPASAAPLVVAPWATSATIACQ